MSIDPYSVTWAAVEAHCRGEIETLRDQLESPLSEVESAVIRGHIRAYRAILALAAPKPPAQGKNPLI